MEQLEEYFQEQMTYLWGQLVDTFPEADIRFQREQGSPTLHILLRDEATSDHSVEIDLHNLQTASYEALLSIKAILRKFDA